MKTTNNRKNTRGRNHEHNQVIGTVIKHHPHHNYGGFRDRNTQAIYNPGHGMFKGYMRENRSSTFNKNK